jgi:hypothetical protein
MAPTASKQSRSFALKIADGIKTRALDKSNIKEIVFNIEAQ